MNFVTRRKPGMTATALWLALLGISAAGAAVLGVVGFRKRRKEGAE